MPTLDGLHLLPDLLNKLHGLKDYFGSSHNLVTNLPPTNRGTTSPTIQEFKRRSTNDGVIIVVVGELCNRYVGILTSTKINDTCPKHILKGLYHPLTLVVSLRMISSTEMQPRAQFLVEVLP